MRFKHIEKLFSILSMGALLVSCQDIDLQVTTPDPQTIKVGIQAGDVSTRTQIQENGLSTVWTEGDKLSVWAVGSSGEAVLSNQVFTAYGTDAGRGFFTSELASQMPEDTYIYYCTYPAPSSIEGNTAVFNVPAIQDGKVTSGADVLVATPVTHGALAPLPEIEDHSAMKLKMNHMMHQFRFFVPQDDEHLQDAQITRMVLTFPEPVVGQVQLNISDPEQNAVLSAGYREVTLDLAEPISVENRKNACLALVPTKFSEGQSLEIKAYTSDKIVYISPVNLRAKECLPGHSTPVQLMVQSVEDYPYQIAVKVAGNNLGEDVNSITLTAPSGCAWPNSSSNVYTFSPGTKIKVGDEFVLRFEDEAQYRAFSGKTISVTYDSDCALTHQSVTMANLSSTDKTSLSLTVPYLFYEDFSGIPSFNDGHDNPIVGTGSDTYKGISELSSYTSELSGWYGTRIGGQSGTSVRICCRYEHVLLAGAYYKGRVYTPPLSNIKEGVDANIVVSFKYAGDRNERKGGVFGTGSKPNKDPILYFGINTQAEVTNPDYQEGNIIDDITGLYAGSGYASSTVTSLSPMAIKGEALSVGGSYTSFHGTKTLTISGVDCDMRLGWILSTNNTSSNTNANYWLYLDDIKVQIAK